MKIVFVPGAQQDLIEAIEWYEEQREGLGAEFSIAVKESLRLIARTLQVWPVVLKDARRYQMRRFPFGIVYRPTPSRLEVIAIAHTSRKPGYWRKR